MKKYSIVLSLLIVIAVAAPAGAYNYNYDYDYGYGGYTSPYSAIVETFDPNSFDGENFLPNVSIYSSSNRGWTMTGNFEVRQGSITPAAAPWWNSNGGARDATYFLTVPRDPIVNGISVTIDFNGAAYNYFGLWWGSMDSYNTLEFLDESGGVIDTVTGGLPLSPGSGAQDLSLTNRYVNLYGMGDFYGVRMTSTSYAFESDNLAVGYNVVPEPLTAILLGFGLLGLLGLRRMMR